MLSYIYAYVNLWITSYPHIPWICKPKGIFFSNDKRWQLTLYLDGEWCIRRAHPRFGNWSYMVMLEVFVITVAIIVWSIYRSVQRKWCDTTSKQLARLWHCWWEKSCTSGYPKFHFSIGLNLRIVYFFASSRTSFTQTPPAKGLFFVQILKLSVILEANDDLLNWTPPPQKKNKQTIKPSPGFISGEAIP